jgi:hypothetical protein
VSINWRINISSSIIIRVTYWQHEELLGEKPNGIRTTWSFCLHKMTRLSKEIHWNIERMWVSTGVFALASIIVQE